MGSILHTGSELENAIQRLDKARDSGAGKIEKVFAPTLVVRGEAVSPPLLPLTGTVAKHANGLSKAEIERVSKAAHFMRRFGTPIFVTTEDHDAAERSARNLFSQVKNHTVKIQRDLQKQLGRPVPAYWTEVLESKYAVHSHLITVVPVGRFARETIERLKSSRLFGDNLKAKPAYDVNRLVGYLSKEATTQAHYALCYTFRRNAGPHRLGTGGGDRVRLSGALEADMIREGLIMPYRKTYASRALPKVAKVRKVKPYFRPVQLGLPLDLPSPPPILKLVEEKRVEQKLTQREAAQLLGIKQAGYSNALREHDRLSSWSMNRAREYVADRIAA